MKRHFIYIDYLRFFAMLDVIFVHICGVVLNRTDFGSANWELLHAGSGLGYSSVAIFFMISGFLLLQDKNTADVGLLLKKRLPRLVLPLLGWTAVAALWIGHLADDYSLTGILSRFLNGLYEPVMVHFWFIFTLIALYVLSPVLYGGLNGLDRRGRLFVLAIILILNLRHMLQCVLPDGVYRFCGFDLLNKLELLEGAVSTFILGWYLGRLTRRIPNWILAAAAVLLLAAITVGSRAFYLQTGDYAAPFHRLTLGFQVCLSACIFLLFKQNVRDEGKSFFFPSAIPLCFPIYFLHIIMMELIFGLGWTPVSFAGVLGFTLVNFILCYLLTKIAASIPVVCRLATGLSFKSACSSCSWQYSFRRLREKKTR